MKNMDAQVFSPPYLFKKVGGKIERKSQDDRPQIKNAPDVLQYSGAEFEVTSTHPIGQDGLLSFTLVKHSSVTHSFNNGQSFKNLEVNATAVINPTTREYRYKIKMPNNNEVTPGYYMLFAVSKDKTSSKNNKTPSVAKSIRIH
jgi:hypothetical protein